MTADSRSVHPATTPSIEQRAVVVGDLYEMWPGWPFSMELKSLLAELPWGPINLSRVKAVLEKALEWQEWHEAKEAREKAEAAS